MSGRFTYADIIHTDISRIAIAMNVAVEDNNRYSRFVCFFHYGCHGIRLVWRTDDYIKMILHKITDIIRLLLVAVIGRAYLYRCFWMKHNFALYFIITLVAPVVRAALRDSYTECFLLLTTAEKTNK